LSIKKLKCDKLDLRTFILLILGELSFESPINHVREAMIAGSPKRGIDDGGCVFSGEEKLWLRLGVSGEERERECGKKPKKEIT